MSPEGVSGSDAPKLKGVLEAPSGKQTPVEVSEGPNDSILASFVPEEPGKNLLHIKKGNKEIDGSPIPIMVREAPIIGKESEIPLECADCELPKDLPKLKGVLTRPNGKEEPVKVEEAPDSTIACTFVPEEPGKHLLKVCFILISFSISTRRRFDVDTTLIWTSTTLIQRRNKGGSRHNTKHYDLFFH